jgi:hypothetical protein
MKHKLLTYAFVGVWEKAPSVIPTLDNRFCLDLFGDPYNTKTWIGIDGFHISKTLNEPGQIVPNVVINNFRIQVSSSQLSETSSVFEKVTSALQSADSGIENSFAQAGYNVEYEITELGTTYQSWLATNFFNERLYKGETGFMILGQDMNFVLVSGPVLYNVVLQPRLNNPEAAFFQFNRHVGEPSKVLDGSCLEKQFSEVQKEIEQKVFKTLQVI